jgi:hypothetical protein
MFQRVKLTKNFFDHSTGPLGPLNTLIQHHKYEMIFSKPIKRCVATIICHHIHQGKHLIETKVKNSGEQQKFQRSGGLHSGSTGASQHYKWI